MKNIHVLPTDKQSRLYLHSDNELQLRTNIIRTSEDYLGSNQHIYITSDEEIKDAKWIIHNGKIHEVTKNKGLYISVKEVSHIDIRANLCKKIILTTDQHLIKDGVQAIDDTFLEWFVKNPSYEWVEVGYGWIRLTETDNEGYWVSIPDKQFEMQQEEPKQETLEEAAEINSEKHHYAFGQQSEFYQLGFIEGAKRQAERMYSEEEVRKIAEDAYSMGKNNILIGVFNKWFEQFKKK